MSTTSIQNENSKYLGDYTLSAHTCSLISNQHNKFAFPFIRIQKYCKILLHSTHNIYKKVFDFTPTSLCENWTSGRIKYYLWNICDHKLVSIQLSGGYLWHKKFSTENKQILLLLLFIRSQVKGDFFKNNYCFMHLFKRVF